MKVGVMLSGGLDSSVAAGMLLEQGLDLIGITMLNWSEEPAARGAAVAKQLNIPHYIVNLKEEFERLVVNSFCDAYGSGLTPNPCISCNEHIKFGLLMEAASQLGCQRIATGHYARIISELDGVAYLHKGLDESKDQSYFLYRISPDKLARIMFPLGNLTKSQVREWAASRGLSELAEGRESQEVCFINGFYGDFLRERMEMRPGPVLDIQGRQLGEHEGLPLYTIGQRRGLGIAAGRPVYVAAMDHESNTLFLGDAEELFAEGLEASDIVWWGPKPDEPFAVTAKIRYASRPAAALIEFLENETLRVRFMKGQRAITPGQSVVLYDGSRVLGGGIIARAFRC